MNHDLWTRLTEAREMSVLLESDKVLILEKDLFYLMEILAHYERQVQQKKISDLPKRSST